MSPVRADETPTNRWLESVERNLHLLEAKVQADTAGAATVDSLIGRLEIRGELTGVRDLPPAGEPEVLLVPIDLDQNLQWRVRGQDGGRGVLLGGDYVVRYVRMKETYPSMERLLDMRKQESQLQSELIDSLEVVIGIKDRMEVVYQGLVDGQEQRAELYKKMYEAERGNWFTSGLRKIAFPAGITVGLIAGAILAD